MSFLSHRRDGAYAVWIAVGVVAVISAVAVISILCVVRYGGETDRPTAEGSWGISEEMNQAADQSAVESFNQMNFCKKERKIITGNQERLESYFTTYLLCAEPALASDKRELDSRISYLVGKFEEVFQNNGSTVLPPGSTVQILGVLRNESIDGRYGNEQHATP